MSALGVKRKSSVPTGLCAVAFATPRLGWRAGQVRGDKLNRGSGSDPSRQGAVEPQQVHGWAVPPPVLPIG